MTIFNRSTIVDETFFASLMIYCPFFIAFMVITDAVARKASKKSWEDWDD
ncbi:hypothetical protein MFMK1_001469 [Metallumcola ferriviriculae]|uniref:Uncharacterized protein n=1 Tax=Metallumcola ferriviriculae TaxID=3039180 RepID=A0AAU0UNA2_9FIRM|nr:hypothetical protein MFMK1_001469 [Desulfitibacteraceae bacterium MK1]